MKASIITSTVALFGTALAYPSPAPSGALFTIQLANDISGANAIRSVPANGVANTFINVFANTVLVKDGAIKATSLQNVAPGGANVNCVVRTGGLEFVGEINNQKTFLDLDGVAGRAEEKDVSNFTITCS
ncbi:hypothetical protein SVAN01_02886 [Stagonosporopsis vannaccii]|nr:hypothetical protein SVAN01_02886 [Stagonosporopsis vannaccii]